MKINPLLCLLVQVVTCTNDRASLVMEITQLNSQSHQRLHQDLDNIASLPNRYVDIWRETGEAIVVALNLKAEQEVTQILQTENIKFEIIIDDVPGLIQESIALNARARMDASATRFQRGVSDSRASILKYYANYTEIVDWLEGLVNRYPNLAKVFSIGTSFEQREIISIKLSSGEGRPRVVIDGGVHAREWISPASLLNLIHKILGGYNSNNNRFLLDNFDWVIVPVCNPDGYEYSHTSEEGARMWRKTRRNLPGDDSSPGDECIGVDLNRNYPYHWKKSDPRSCSKIFSGAYPLSEPESQAISRLLLDPQDTPLYISVHSFGQLVATRWAYKKCYPADHRILMKFVETCAKAMTNVDNNAYRAGTMPNLLYSYSGGSPDYARGVANITYSITIELRDDGTFAFLLPPSFIPVTSEELFAGIESLASQVLQYRHAGKRESVSNECLSKEEMYGYEKDRCATLFCFSSRFLLFACLGSTVSFVLSS